MRLGNKRVGRMARAQVVHVPKRDVELRTAEGSIPTRAATGRTVEISTIKAPADDLLSALLEDLHPWAGDRA